MAAACALSLIIIITAQVNLNSTFRQVINVTNPLASFALLKDDLIRGESQFGVMAGVYFIMIAIALLLMFKELFRLINSGHRLSESLQH